MNLQADREKNWHEFSKLLTGASDPNLRIVALAAHPDDETIGASVVLARFPQSSVVFLTDGAPRDTSLWSAGVHGSREQYAQTRRREAATALSFAGISESQMFWLGAVDQEAAFEIPALIERFAAVLSQNSPDVVITHPYEGGHPDHDTAALVAASATAMINESSRPLLVEMTSYHARDGRCVTGEFLNGESSPFIAVELSRDDQRRKRGMIDAYASQRLVLESFPIDREPLRLAPQYDFAQPPHEGKLWYECLGWEMTGARWRERASAALADLQEHSCR